jgi:hypothetical protein
MSADERGVQDAVRWLESRVRKDPEDFVAHNKLGGYYLQRLRETGDATFLARASRAARASLALRGSAMLAPAAGPIPAEDEGCAAPSRATVTRGLNSSHSLAWSFTTILTGTGFRH